ncbi:MAG: hypothetical protein RLN75_06060 [Longimicrobiales bacterium]
MDSQPSSRFPCTPVRRWSLDPSGCRLLLALPDARFRGLRIDDARGWVRLNEDDLVGSELSARLSIRDPLGVDPHTTREYVFEGTATRRGADDEAVFEGRLRIGARVAAWSLAVIPTRCRHHGGTEYLDLDVRAPLPPELCGSSRVEGRLRILRASPAA